MAEYIFDKKIKDKKIANVKGCSAGIYASDGDCISEDAARVLKEEYGADASGFKSARFDAKRFGDCALIIAMTREHKTALADAFERATKDGSDAPAKRGCQRAIYAVGEILNEGDVSDPYFLGIEAYKRAAAQIETAIDAIIERFL
jgi:protein-tyrosine-phosphatase